MQLANKFLLLLYIKQMLGRSGKYSSPEPSIRFSACLWFFQVIFQCY